MRACLVSLMVLALGAPAAAQGVPPQPQRQAPDFFFSKPRASVTVRGSWMFARSDSDWYDFVTNHLTLERSDFNAPGFGLDVGVPLTNRLEAQFSFDVNRAHRTSEYRAYEEIVGGVRVPIEQVTTLREINLGGNLKFALAPRGREISRLAWIPRAVVPYVGGGAGAAHYNLTQSGDFVDFVDLSIFPELFVSDGWTASAQVFGGVDVRVLKRVYVTFDGRYLWAAADLGRDWIDFDPIDLAGFRLSGGVNFVF